MSDLTSPIGTVIFATGVARAIATHLFLVLGMGAMASGPSSFACKNTLSDPKVACNCIFLRLLRLASAI